jgi:hypothetical protein
VKMIRFSFVALLALAIGASVPAFAQHNHDGDSRHDGDKDKDKGKYKDKGRGDRHQDRDDRGHHDERVRHEVHERHEDHGRHEGWERRDWAHERHEHQEWAKRNRRHFIREEHYVAYFGPVHRFRIVRPVLVAGRPRFQYGGYWFVIGRPLPRGWYYTDEVYVDYMGDGYYMASPAHPGVRISIDIL